MGQIIAAFAGLLLGIGIGWCGCYFGAGRKAALENEALQRELLIWKRDR